jgi:Domain of unknown function (DUF4398)
MMSRHLRNPGMIDPLSTSWYGPVALRRHRDLPIAAVAAFAAMIAGCGPIEYLNQVSNKASSAVAAAKAAEADRYAPYEYTAAEEYLHKAREEAGYAEYQDAIEYGRKSEELANRARAIAATHGSKGATAAPASERKRRETE